MIEPDDSFAFSRHDADAQELLRSEWQADVRHFKSVRISTKALLKMSLHAEQGGDLEILGLLQGKVRENEFTVTDAFALPVTGTETRVNATSEGDEYAVEYLRLGEMIGRTEAAVGWYHSHPGYGCWLSGVDVATQRFHQLHQEPWLAVVVDPKRSVQSGRVELKAFRTFPEGYNEQQEQVHEANDDDGDGNDVEAKQRRQWRQQRASKSASASASYSPIPTEKMEQFGAFAACYYEVPVSYYESELDARLLEQLWSRHWVATLSSSSRAASTLPYRTAQIRDIAKKCEGAERAIRQRRSRSQQGGGGSGGTRFLSAAQQSTFGHAQLEQVVADASMATATRLHDLIALIVKDESFQSKR
jgi:COP9 signalosome complex subunit 5